MKVKDLLPAGRKLSRTRTPADTEPLQKTKECCLLLAAQLLPMFEAFHPGDDRLRRILSFMLHPFPTGEPRIAITQAIDIAKAAAADVTYSAAKLSNVIGDVLIMHDELRTKSEQSREVIYFASGWAREAALCVVRVLELFTQPKTSLPFDHEKWMQKYPARVLRYVETHTNDCATGRKLLEDLKKELQHGLSNVHVPNT